MFRRRSPKRTTGEQKRKLRIEELEHRCLLAVVTVDTESDVIDFNDGLTSLREAIFATNVVPGSDRIEFDPSLAGKTILLAKGDLRITDDLTISWMGPNMLTIDASGSDPTPNWNDGRGSRVFTVDDGDDQRFVDVMFEGLAITGGDTASYGGGIFSHENLTLVACRVADNTSGGYSEGRGAGIFSQFGYLEIESSSVTGNLSNYGNGAGVYVSDGNVSILDSVISQNGNAPHLGQDGGGGGIFAIRSGVTIKRTIVEENDCWVGGGIAVGDCTMSIEESFIRGNHALMSNSAIAASDSNVEIKNTIVEENSSYGNCVSLNRGTTSIVRSVFRQNSFDFQGPDVAFVIFGDGDVSIIDSDFSHNRQSIFSFSGNLYMSGCTISNNDSKITWGIELYGNSFIQSTTISDNQWESRFVDSWHAGIYIQLDADEKVVFSHSTIYNNSMTDSDYSPDDRTAGILHSTSYSRGQVVLDHSVVANNLLRDLVSGEINRFVDVRGTVQANHSFVGVSIDPLEGVNNTIGADTRLGPLEDNGGPELPGGNRLLTRRPLPGSPLVDSGDLNAVAGVDDVPVFDQRGAPYERVFDGNGDGVARIDIGAVEVNVILPQLWGDYNYDNVVDAADYSVWRDTLRATGLVPYSGADGDGDGTVDQDDYVVWKANFGRTAEAGSVESGAGSGKPRIEKLFESNFLLQGEVEELTAGQASSGTRAIQWKHELAPLGLRETRGQMQRRPPADLEAGNSTGAGGRVRVAVENRDLALLAWRAGFGRRADQRLPKISEWELGRGGDAEEMAFVDVDAAIELLADGVPELMAV